CERTAFGHLEPGLQTGYCTDTGGGWSIALVAHDSQLHAVPETMSDEAAVMGAGPLGLCTIAALRYFGTPAVVIAAAKHPEQRALARQLGADVVVEPD